MTYVVPRSGGRYEVRESAHTDRGPRARTLVSFRELSGEVLDRAEARAVGPFDRDALRRRALELGAPMADRDSTVDLLARRLLSRLSAGATVSAPLAALLAERLGPVEAPDGLEGAVEWLGASDAQRGHALWDLLELADALPDHDPGLNFPPLRRAA